MQCTVCGADIPGNASHCGSCGTDFFARCEHCHATLPPAARFCPSCGKPAAATPPARPDSEKVAPGPAGERKLLTVLFADFEGFTAYADHRDAEDVHDYIGSLWDRLCPIIVAHGGTVEKYMGDAIMALFGEQQVREDDAAQAVRAGLAMQVRLRTDRSQLPLRIAVNTGLVVIQPAAGPGGFRATGDTINVASRLQKRAPAGGLIISQHTFPHVNGLFELQPCPPLQVEGKSEPILSYVVLAARPRSAARRIRGVPDARTEMVGRDAELQRLQTTFAATIANQSPALVTLAGDAGLGKSRLLEEFLGWIEPQGTRPLIGRATPELSSSPFALMRDVFATHFGIQDNDSAAVAREKFETGVATTLAERPGAESASEAVPLAVAHCLGHLLGMDFSGSTHLAPLLGDARLIRERAFQYAGRLFAAFSHGPGAVLVAEDIHWCDEGSLDLIEHLARNCRDAPLLIVCTTRPALFERRRDWAEASPERFCVQLNSLSAEDSRRLIAHTLRRAGDIPQELSEQILGRAEGNPFYIEEIIKMFIEKGVIVCGPETWSVEPGRLAAFTLPPTLTGVLQARLDGLKPLERTVAQRASVIGRVFWDTALERLGPVAEPGRDLSEALGALQQKGLIFRQASSAFAGANEFSFTHELLRNAAYENILKSQRRVYHGQVAGWLVDQGGERVAPMAGLVATHLEKAGRASDAAEWFGRAGQQARASYDPVTAVESYRKAFELSGEANTRELQARELEWRQGFSECLAAQARFAEATEGYGRMQQLAELLGDDLARARAWNGLAFLHERQGDNQSSVAAAERALFFCRKAGPPARREEIKALHLKGWAFYRLSDAPAVLALADETLRLCKDLDDRPGLAQSYKLHGVAHLQLGHYLEADEFFQKGLALSEEWGDRRNAAAMWNNRGETARMRGDYPAAIGFYQEALAISRQIGSRESELIYLCNLSGARLGLRECAQAEADLRRVIALTPTAQACMLSETYRFLAEACLEQEKHGEALAAAQQALELARGSNNHLDLASAWRALGRILARNPAAAQPSPATAAGDVPADAAHCFDQSLRAFRLIGAEGEAARTLRSWAEFEARAGRNGAAREKLEAAREIFRRLQMPEAT